MDVLYTKMGCGFNLSFELSFNRFFRQRYFCGIFLNRSTLLYTVALGFVSGIITYVHIITNIKTDYCLLLRSFFSKHVFSDVLVIQYWNNNVGQMNCVHIFYCNYRNYNKKIDTYHLPFSTSAVCVPI